MSDYEFPQAQDYGKGCKHIWRFLDNEVKTHPEHGLVAFAYCYNCGTHATAKIQMILKPVEK